VRAVGTVVPVVREIAGVVYQFSAPFVLDDGAARAHFGLQPTPWSDTLAIVIRRAGAATSGRAT